MPTFRSEIVLVFVMYVIRHLAVSYSHDLKLGFGRVRQGGKRGFARDGDGAAGDVRHREAETFKRRLGTHFPCSRACRQPREGALRLRHLDALGEAALCRG